MLIISGLMFLQVLGTICQVVSCVYYVLANVNFSNYILTDVGYISYGVSIIVDGLYCIILRMYFDDSDYILSNMGYISYHVNESPPQLFCLVYETLVFKQIAIYLSPEPVTWCGYSLFKNNL